MKNGIIYHRAYRGMRFEHPGTPAMADRIESEPVNRVSRLCAAKFPVDRSFVPHGCLLQYSSDATTRHNKDVAIHPIDIIIQSLRVEEIIFNFA